MSELNGARIALLEARMTGELANLVRRHGGAPYCVPAVREAPLVCGEREVALIRELAAGSFRAVVFLTGAGVRSLFQEAERLRCRAELQTALKGMIVVCRGPKPAAVLKANNLTCFVNVRAPYTTTELLEAIDRFDLVSARVALLHYGERNAILAEALRTRGAHLEELCLYEWLLPEDTAPLHALVREIIAGQVEAVAFTSQVQVRHLFQVAAGARLVCALVRALNTRTIVASVGPTCTDALQYVGVRPRVVPEHPKMGPMVIALARYHAALNATSYT